MRSGVISQSCSECKIDCKDIIQDARDSYRDSEERIETIVGDTRVVTDTETKVIVTVTGINDRDQSTATTSL